MTPIQANCNMDNMDNMDKIYNKNNFIKLKEIGKKLKKMNSAEDIIDAVLQLDLMKQYYQIRLDDMKQRHKYTTKMVQGLIEGLIGCYDCKKDIKIQGNRLINAMGLIYEDNDIIYKCMDCYVKS